MNEWINNGKYEKINTNNDEEKAVTGQITKLAARR